MRLPSGPPLPCRLTGRIRCSDHRDGGSSPPEAARSRSSVPVARHAETVKGGVQFSGTAPIRHSRAHRPTAGCRLRTAEIGVQVPVGPPTTSGRAAEWDRKQAVTLLSLRLGGSIPHAPAIRLRRPEASREADAPPTLNPRGAKAGTPRGELRRDVPFGRFGHAAGPPRSKRDRRREASWEFDSPTFLQERCGER